MLYMYIRMHIITSASCKNGNLDRSAVRLVISIFFAWQKIFPLNQKQEHCYDLSL